jgi:hypothetical protein
MFKKRPVDAAAKDGKATEGAGGNTELKKFELPPETIIKTRAAGFGQEPRPPPSSKPAGWGQG